MTAAIVFTDTTGTVGRTGVIGLVIGNTAEKILNDLSCSVLAVKPDDFVSPALSPISSETSFT